MISQFLKIKSLNYDLIEQVRKMNDYGSQHITNVSNGYTETNQDNDNKGNISYLTDANDKTSLYMSDYTNSKKKQKSKHFNIVYQNSNKTLSKSPEKIQTKHDENNISASKIRETKHSEDHISNDNVNIKNNSVDKTNIISDEINNVDE